MPTDTRALSIPDPADLETCGDRKLNNAIRKGHAAAGAHRAAYEEHAITTGVLLIERKRRLKHGEWLPWLAEHFEGDRKTATRYMTAGHSWLDSNGASAPHLQPESNPPESAEPEVVEPERKRRFTDEEIEAMAEEARRRREEMEREAAERARRPPGIRRAGEVER